MIVSKIFESFDENLEKILKKIIKKNQINIFQSEEWIKTNIKIFNENKYTKIFFVVCFEKTEPIIFLPMTIKKINGIKILSWLDSPASDYCGAIIDKNLNIQNLKQINILNIIRTKFKFDVLFLQKIREETVKEISIVIPHVPHKYQNTYFLNLKKFNFEDFYYKKNNSKSRETDRRKEKKIIDLKVNFQIIKNNIESLKKHLEKKEEFYKNKNLKTFDSRNLFQFYNEIYKNQQDDKFEFYYSTLENSNFKLSSIFGLKFNKTFYYLIPLVEKSPFSNLSPGKFNLIFLIKYLLKYNDYSIDFGPGNEVYKMNWSNEKKSIYYALEAYTLKGFFYYFYKKNYFMYRNVKILKYLKNKFL